MSGEAAGDARCPSCGAAEVRHEFDLGCEICAACGHVLSERALTTSVQYDEDGAQGVFLHDGGTRGQHLAAARSGLAMATGSAPGVARAMFRDEQSTHLANINRSVDFAAQQLRLTKDAADDARALVVRASEGRWGEGDWTTLLVGACVYTAARQNTLPIAMRDVAEACQLDVFALGRVYNKLKRLFDVVVPPVRVETFVARAAAAVPELTKESITRRNNNKTRLESEDDRKESLTSLPIGRSSFASEVPKVPPTAKVPPTETNAEKPSKENDAFTGTRQLFPETLTTTHVASRAKDLAPLVEDAKALLEFAKTRGLLVGRNPVPFVAAALGVAAEARGVCLSHEKTASAARASFSAARRASQSLRKELVAFANTFEWGKHVRVKNLPAFAPSLVPHVAGALEANRTNGVVSVAESESDANVASVSAALARDAARRVEAMPVSFRAHEKTRLAREARLRRAKEETLAALDAAGEAFFSRETRETENLDAATNGTHTNAEPERDARANEEGDAPGASSESLDVALEKIPVAAVAVKRPSRGGVRRRRRAPDPPAETQTETQAEPRALLSSATLPRDTLAFSHGGDVSFGSRVRDEASREVNPIAVKDTALETHSTRALDFPSGAKDATEPDADFDFDWSDVALRRLLLEGVPDAFLEQEKALHAGCDESRDGFTERDTKKSKSKSTTLATDFDAASEAARRVRRRTRDASFGRDVLLGGSSLPGGVTWKTPSATFVEQRDKEAMDAIPDEEIECLLRTEAERDFARALAAREAAERGGTTEEDLNAARGEDGDDADAETRLADDAVFARGGARAKRDGDRRRGPVKAERGV